MNIDEAIHLAIEHYHRGNLEQSESICREILRMQPNNAQILHLLGVICYLFKKYDSAIKYIRESLHFYPSDAEANYNCGNAFKDKEQYDEAATCYKKALQFDPHNSSIFINLGYVLERKGDLNKAMKCYQEALKINPDNAIAHFNLGNTFLDKGLFDEAIHHYQKTIAINPSDADAYNYLGAVYQDKGQLDKAISCYEKAVNIDPDRIIYNNLFLIKSKGVIHVGANLGQERELYAAFGLNVIWIEPIPEVFNRLNTLIYPFPKQKAFCYLVTDVDDREYLFHISNKGGGASSIFDLAGHKELWPDVGYTETLTLKSITLSSLIKKECLDLTAYDVLVLDTQGSELLVLKGAYSILPHIKYIRAEVADFEAYLGCCKFDEMDNFFEEYNFRRIAKGRFAHKKDVGSYYEVLYVSESKAR